MFKNVSSVYMIGIGGISMSALAQMLKEGGVEVKGSDIRLSDLTAILQKQGIEVVEGNCPQFVKWCDALVYSGAISSENSDLTLAKKLGKPVYSRAELLGFLSKNKKTISIAGTHGKTTTTGMISTILMRAGIDASLHIGGRLKEINSNFHIGESDVFVTEACEYQNAFLTLSNHISVVLNIENDHLDYFKNFDNICNSFNKFIENTKKNGLIVYNYESCKDILNLSNKKSLSFGLDAKADLFATNICQHKQGRYSFDAIFHNKHIGHFKLACFGKHNIYNALASMAVCLSMGINVERIQEGISQFQGVERRMDLISDKPLIIHDYAHHPHEITATLNAIKAISNEKIICIFQPHTYTRTQALYNEFLSCFDLSDEVWLLPIYSAREAKLRGVTSKKLRRDLIQNGQMAKHFSTFDSCLKEINKAKYLSYTFAILGAGDIVDLAKNLRK